MSHVQTPPEAPQPFMPQFGNIWYFIVATLVAIALGIVRSAEQGQAMAAAMVLIGVFVVAYGCVAALSFIVSFSLGAVETAIDDESSPASPFAKDALPDKVELINAPEDV